MGGISGVAEDSVAHRPRARWLRARMSSPLSIRTYMVGLILVVVVPLLAFSAFLVLRSAEHEQEIMASTVRERTQATAAMIDHELSLLRSRLFVMAGSKYLQAGDFAAFHTQATQTAREDGLNVVLSDLTGQEIVNTRLPFGDKLPVTTALDTVRRIVATGQPDISDLTIGAVSRQPVIGVAVPVFRDDRLDYVLSLNIAPRLPKILAQLDLPTDWIITISDRRGYTIARSRDAERFVGQMGRPAILERFRAANDGWFPSNSREGIPVYNAFTHVKLSGWTVVIGIPNDILFAPVRRSTVIVMLVGLVTVGIALITASLIGHRIARPIRALVTYAERIGRGERLPVHPTGINETDAVAQSLHRAGEQLHQSGESRDQAAHELRESEQKYRALAEALAAANEERSELLHRTVLGQEAERKRIARELHDSLGQYLTALGLGFDAIAPICATDETARRRVRELKELTAQLGRDFSRMAWELRPIALDDLGLRNAMTQYLEEWAERSGLQIDLEITLGDRRLPAAVETGLFRVLQEAVTNVVKHSGADQVGVVLEATNGEVRLIVEDNGRGFEMDEGGANIALDRTHLGLLGVRERLALVNGSLEVESAGLGGTTVYACVPIGERRAP
jgi:signal transduction histidine kinase